MKYFILLNRKFPFLSGEPFLENEINIYIDKIDKFIIFPSNIKKGDKLTRTTNNKVSSIVIEDNNFKYRRFKSAIIGLKYMIYPTRRLNDNNIGKSLLKKAYWGYFEQSANEQFRKIYKEIKKIGFNQNDEIVIYSYWLYINAKVAVLLGNRLRADGLNVKIISRAHRFDIYEDTSRIKYLPQREEIFNGLDKVYVCSQNGEQYLKRRYPKFNNKICTSRLGTHDNGIGRFDFKNKINIVSCSRMTSVKRIDKIVDVLKLLKNSDKEISWTHLGGGELMEHISKRVKDELSFMNVNITGMMDNSKIYEYYKSNPVDLFINVSSSEGLPVSIMEAISFGIPVIATDVGGTNEIVINDRSGYLIEKDFEVSFLEAKIKDFISMDYNSYYNLRLSTRNEWENNFQANKNYLEFYNMVEML